LTNIIIPDGVESIGSYAFETNQLEVLTLPASVSSLGTRPFFRNGPTSNSSQINDFVPSTLQTRNLQGTAWVKQ
jgi:hypothetical protein